MQVTASPQIKDHCYPCGDECTTTPIYTDEKAFCCTGCKSVYELSQMSLQVILFSFCVSFIYNIIGLTLAIMGNFSPIISAILIPISSISVVLAAVIGVRVVAWRMGLTRHNKTKSSSTAKGLPV